jgi:hypothetical protein
MSYNIYCKLFNTCVSPILEYGCEVWGTKEFKACNKIQNKAIQFFLGVNRFTPNVGLFCESGWTRCKYLQWIKVFNFWNRMVTMKDSRMCRQIFEIDVDLCKNNWSSDVKRMFEEINLLYIFESKSVCDINEVKERLMEKNAEHNMNLLENSEKLRTYRQFKHDNVQEPYLQLNMEIFERCLLARLRLGVLPLRVETGRYNREELHNRLCKLCKSQEIEDEYHFIMHCELYSDLRSNLLEKIGRKVIKFTTYCKFEQFLYLIKNEQRSLASYVKNCFLRRRDKLFN